MVLNRSLKKSEAVRGRPPCFQRIYGLRTARLFRSVDPLCLCSRSVSKEILGQAVLAEGERPDLTLKQGRFAQCAFFTALPEARPGKTRHFLGAMIWGSHRVRRSTPGKPGEPPCLGHEHPPRRGSKWPVLTGPSSVMPAGFYSAFGPNPEKPKD